MSSFTNTAEGKNTVHGIKIIPKSNLDNRILNISYDLFLNINQVA